MKILPAGTKLRDEHGELLATTVRPIPDRSALYSEDFAFPGGETAIAHTRAPEELITALHRAFRELAA